MIGCSLRSCILLSAGLIPGDIPPGSLIGTASATTRCLSCCDCRTVHAAMHSAAGNNARTVCARRLIGAHLLPLLALLSSSFSRLSTRLFKRLLPLRPSPCWLVAPSTSLECSSSFFFPPSAAMSLFRASAWRNHPMLQVGYKQILIGLPTGIAMFVAFKGAEAVGIVKWDAKSANTTDAARRSSG